VIGLVRQTGSSAIPCPVSVAHVGAAEGCDLLIFNVLISVMKVKRSQPRFTRQLLQGEFARAVPGKLSNNEHGHKKGEPLGSPFFMARFQGRNE
jgi:hypothetical protein